MVHYRRQIILDSLNKYCTDRSSIIEIGCGLDSIANHYQNFKTLTVLEPAKAFYDKCVNDIKNYNNASNILPINATAEEFDCEEKFDFIIISGLLHEVAKPAEILQSIKKLCTTDTVIHINVPNALSFHRLLALEMGLIERLHQKSDTQIRLQQHHTFDKDLLEELVTSCNFHILESESYIIKPFTHKQMKALLDSDLFDVSLLDGLMRLTKYFPNNGCELYMNVAIN
jgi:2-polyprenyl-3-methyl-5-hydroxy-6-metoxy-1,4-benzoquinol methylase